MLKHWKSIGLSIFILGAPTVAWAATGDCESCDCCDDCENCDDCDCPCC